MANGDEDVLQRRATGMVSVRVPGCDRLDAEALREIAKERASARVTAFIRSLQLDEEPVAAERTCEPCGGIRIADREAVARTAGKADEPIVQLLQQRLIERGFAWRLTLASRRPCMRMRCRQQSAQIRIA